MERLSNLRGDRMDLWRGVLYLPSKVSAAPGPLMVVIFAELNNDRDLLGGY